MISVGIKELKAKLSSYVDMVSDSDEVVITVDVKEVACSFQFPGRGKLWSVVASDAHGATLVSLLTIVHDVLAVVRSFFLLSPYPIFLIQD